MNWNLLGLVPCKRQPLLVRPWIGSRGCTCWVWRRGCRSRSSRRCSQAFSRPSCLLRPSRKSVPPWSRPIAKTFKIWLVFHATKRDSLIVLCGCVVVTASRNIFWKFKLPYDFIFQVFCNLHLHSRKWTAHIVMLKICLYELSKMAAGFNKANSITFYIFQEIQSSLYIFDSTNVLYLRV